MTKEFMTEFKRWKNGEITATQAMINANVKRNTFYNLAKVAEMEQV